MDDFFDGSGGGYETGYYDTALICMNGYMVNGSAKEMPQFNTKHCKKCGKPTISQCPHCQKDIQGHYISPGVIGIDTVSVPSYCHECGAAYPWTDAKLEAAKEMADEAEHLSKEEKEELKATFDDLVRDTPKTPVAASRYKRLTAKAGSMISDTLQKILIEVMVSNAKDLIFATHVK
ncbi:MAG TPA: DUF2321 domain-containing protein [Candidatus Acidoferrales bacterium]|nr:DUF2321 domain-containing protein [Candidatus Acidoferrales bacterium]